MFLVVVSDAEDLPRVGNHGQELNDVGGEIRLLSLHNRPRFLQPAAGNQRLQVGIFGTQSRPEIDNALAAYNAVAGSVTCTKRDQFHIASNSICKPGGWVGRAPPDVMHRCPTRFPGRTACRTLALSMPSLTTEQFRAAVGPLHRRSSSARGTLRRSDR